MLQIDVSTPAFGEATTIPGGGTMIANEHTVAVTVGHDDTPSAAFQLPAKDAVHLCGLIYNAARLADPSVNIMDLMGAVVRARA